jgi:hypothetical protein
MMKRDEEEIEEQIGRCYDNKDKYGMGGKWPGMSYEDGVLAALQWVIGNQEEPPMEDDG